MRGSPPDTPLSLDVVSCGRDVTAFNTPLCSSVRIMGLQLGAMKTNTTGLCRVDPWNWPDRGSRSSYTRVTVSQRGAGAWGSVDRGWSTLAENIR